jgi:hypothetical protein
MGGPGSGQRPDPWRRRRVAELRARGLTLPEIGRPLGLSKQLVHYYRPPRPGSAGRPGQQWAGRWPRRCGTPSSGT